MRSQRSVRIDKTLRKFNLNLLLYDISSRLVVIIVVVVVESPPRYICMYFRKRPQSMLHI